MLFESWEQWATAGTVLIVVLCLAMNVAGPDSILMAGLAILMVCGVFAESLPTPEALVAGFGNPGVITIGILFVVAEGMRQTGAMQLAAAPLLGRPRSLAGAQLRLMAPVAGLSAFLNNTPIVAMFIPVIRDWSKKTQLPVSKLFIPLSYAAIMGGTCTLIGTASNIFITGMVRESAADPTASQLIKSVEVGMFTISWVGVPVLVVGMSYILLTSRWLLPNREVDVPSFDDPRRYTVEMQIQKDSPIANKTIEEAGLRNLPGAYLAEIDRDGESIVAVGPEQILRADDRLIFVGVVESVVDLQKTRGLIPATSEVHKVSEPRPNRRLVEAVVSDTCPLVDKTIRDGRFRSVYDAAVIAVHRGGEHLSGKIGDIVLRPGDTLLLETHPNFIQTHRNRRDFFLVSELEDSQPIRHDKAMIALAIVGLMVILSATELMPLLSAALVASGFLIMSGCCSGHEARSSINIRVLLALGAALGIGKAIDATGTADVVASSMLGDVSSLSPLVFLAIVYVTGAVFNMLVGAVGAAAIVFPIAKAAAVAAAIPFTPVIVILMIAAGASYATPIYQTNLMVFTAGGYKSSDFWRFGLPLNVLVGITAVLVAYAKWLA